MRRFTLACCLVLIAGCAPADETDTAETTDAETAEPVAPAVTLADFAGTWSMQALSEEGEVLVEYQLIATEDAEGWAMVFTDRDPIPATVMLEGDELVLDVGPFASALRDDVMVTTHAVSRLVDGMIVGTFTAHYDTESADSVLMGRQEGTRGN